MTKSRVALTIGIIVFISFSFTSACKRGESDTTRFAFLSGKVTANSVAAKVGDPIALNDTIATGDKSLAVLSLGATAQITLYENSRVVLKECDLSNNRIVLGLTDGLLFNKILKKCSYYRVSTPTSTASVRGTTFTVSVDKNSGKTIVRVLSGSLGISKSELPSGEKVLIEKEITVNAGYKIEVIPSAEVKEAAMDEQEKAEAGSLDPSNFIDTKQEEGKTSKHKADVTPAKKDPASLSYDEKLLEIKITNNGKLDVITLNDGRKILGMIIERGPMYRIKTPGGIVSVMQDEIASQTITY
ncbi:MAG: FecR domain-containing protein [Spirochaetes bacterium]|nr:FecR domain-containing protein [Spirochaetota bacterium]